MKKTKLYFCSLLFSLTCMGPTAAAYKLPLENDQHRISVTGALFIRDYSMPSLGEAYRDPSGTIWGDIAIVNCAPIPMNKMNAKKYCARIGARLPDINDINKLNNYLGQSISHLSPYVKGRNDLTVLPHLDLEEVGIWTSTKPEWQGWADFSYVAVPGIIDGAYLYLDTHVARATVRCVVSAYE